MVMKRSDEEMVDRRKGLLQTALVALTAATAIVQSPIINMSPALALDDKVTKGEVTDKVRMMMLALMAD